MGPPIVFLDRRAVEELKLPLLTAAYVTVADRRKIHSSGICTGFGWKIQHSAFQFNLRVLDFGSYDIILKVDWMKSFNPVLFDFEAGQISFQRNSKIVTLKGLTEIQPTALLLPCETLSQLIHKRGNDFISPLFRIQL